LNRNFNGSRLKRARILEAYRGGVISPIQLGQQLEILKTRWNVLNVRRTEIQETQAVDPEQISTAVKDYCVEAANNLAGFTQERWREFLRMIVAIHHL